MKVLAADDEKLALRALETAIKQAIPTAQISAFSKTAELLECATREKFDIAFLDIEMRNITGIELAKRLKDINPGVNIIFVTGYSKYALDALTLRASGYLLKPVTKEAIEKEISQLRNPVNVPEAEIRVQTFGGFEVYVNSKPVVFGRSKAKELLAYLVNKKGAGATTREMAAALWEDKEYSVTLQSYFQTIVSDMIGSLKETGAEKMIIKKRNNLAVDIEQFSCDYYEFLNGDINAINKYAGDYMANYSWAEFTTGYLEQQQSKIMSQND